MADILVLVVFFFILMVSDRTDADDD